MTTTIVSIHAFREGRRPSRTPTPSPTPSFQSTPSAREGDLLWRRIRRKRHSFNPRLPRGKATACSDKRSGIVFVSIHAFREGRRR